MGPVYAVGLVPLIAMAIYRHQSWWWLLAYMVYMVTSLWIIWSTPRWRYLFKTKLRGSIDNQRIDFVDSDLIRAIIVEVENRELSEKGRSLPAIARAFYKSVEGLCYTQVVIHIEDGMNRSTGALDTLVFIRFTMWFNSPSDAVTFKLRNLDVVDFSEDA
jgi:hypothetical protein